MNPEYGYFSREKWDAAILNLPRQNGKQSLVNHIAQLYPNFDTGVERRSAQHSDHMHMHISRAIYRDIDFNTTTRESTMDRTAVIASEIARLQEELATRARFGEDHEDGTILSFDGHFAGNPKVYNYAAIRANGRWHLSGSQARSNMTWSQFVDFLNSVNATNLRKRGKGKVIAE